jgi:hypothetical protein
VNKAFLAAFGGRRKIWWGHPTPQQRTSSSALLLFKKPLALAPGKGLRPLHSSFELALDHIYLRNKKADKTFVDRDEVVSMLRGTTHFELAV